MNYQTDNLRKPSSQEQELMFLFLCSQMLGRRMGQGRLRGELPVPSAQSRRSHLRQNQMRIEASGEK
jgi:hypothetical protein